MKKGENLSRTKILTKGTYVRIDADPFKKWMDGYRLTNQKEKRSLNQTRTSKRKDNEMVEFDPDIMSQIKKGKLLALITSRPGQCGRADGYIIHGRKLDSIKRLENKLETK